MTVLPPVGDASGRGTPVEADELHRCCRAPSLVKYSSEEIELYDKAKEFLGGDFDERILRELVKNFVASRSSNSENILNELLSTYFDRLDSIKDRQIKQVRFEEHLEAPSSTKYLPIVASRQVKTTDRASEVIDLSSEDEKKQWEITDNREEQDMAKAIEASLKENQNILGFSPFAQKDSENPYERLRVELSPVGLKNIGNSCWFNVIIQTLFNIPAFRQMVLDYEFSLVGVNGTGCGDKPSSSNEPANPTIFIIALRRLFAFLLGTKRSYIDPTETINVVNDLATTLLKAVSCVGIQQDCTEMLLRFTEWLEKTFETPRVASTGDTGTKPLGHRANAADRPMTSSANDENIDPVAAEVITGRSSAVNMDHENRGGALGFHPGIKGPEAVNSESCKQSEPGLHPLVSGDARDSIVDRITSDINCNNQNNPFTTMFHGSHVELRNTRGWLINLDVSFGNLHDSFEAYHLSGIPSNELWYETAPPVIVFSLVRFSYKNGQTEKIHSRFHFPRSFYLDRYLIKNREFVLENRVKKTNLTRKRMSLTKELDRLLKYPVGNSHESLPDTIGAVLKFIHNDSVRCGEEEDVEPMEVGDESGVIEDAFNSNNDRFTPVAADTSVLMSSVDAEDSSVKMMEKNLGPEVTTVTTFLQALAKDIQLKINSLQTEVNSLNTQIETIYDVETMMEECYRLHSVIIHEGEANVGHYWAYIADCSKLDANGMPVVWRKYNDKSVELATYEQMEEDAYGSKRTCSAYCIVYTRRLSEETLFGNEPYLKLTSVDEIVQSVPVDLRNEVTEDNARFMEELRSWDNQQNIEVAGPNYGCALSKDLRYLLSRGKTAGDNCEWARYYENAYNSCGVLIVKKALNKLRKEAPDSVCGNDEMNKKCFEEMLLSSAESIKDIFDNKLCSSDRRIVLSEWARISGITLSPLAAEIFFLRMFAVSNFTSLSTFCNDRINLMASQGAAFTDAEKELLRLLKLYNLYNEAIGVLAEATRRLWKYRGTRELSRDIGQAKLVHYTTRLFEIYWSNCRGAGTPVKDVEIDLILIVLMMMSSVHVSQDFVEYISETTNDRVLAENNDFLSDDYVRLLHRLKNCDSQSTLVVRLKTVQYVMSLWEYLQRRLNSDRVAYVVELLREGRSYDLKYNAPTEANFEGFNLAQDLNWIAEFVSHTGLHKDRALQILLKSSASGAKINSLQILPEDEVRKA